MPSYTWLAIISARVVNNHQYFYTVNNNKDVVLMTDFCAVLNFNNAMATDHKTDYTAK